jgi:mannose/cellobiose epimerase-like protein (N-acyl-D-glucosamine 2-epimerase family)
MCLTVTHQPVDPTRRLWSQTEALKAHLCIAKHGPEELLHIAIQRAIDCAESIHDQWLDTECRGGFYDHFDAKGKLLASDIPASMGYHLYVAIMELSETAKEMERLPRPKTSWDNKN